MLLPGTVTLMMHFAFHNSTVVDIRADALELFRQEGRNKNWHTFLQNLLQNRKGANIFAYVRIYACLYL